MKTRNLFLLLAFLSFFSNAQIASKYNISFENGEHHEAEITAQFTNLKSSEVELTMSRSSPGRYALHEFVKNVYNLSATDSKGNKLETIRINPYKWKISGHDGSLNIKYTLYANHGDGTYAQIDATHAHLNAPATYMFIPELSNQGYEVTFNIKDDSNWRIATQLKHVKANTYYAKDLQYLMDSPIEISNYKKRSFEVDGQTINFVLHDENATNEDADDYFENVKRIVLQQKAVFRELPKYDYGEYTFLACYMPNVEGDGMEHRNSTVLTTTRSLAYGGKEQNISTVAHEFFHCWNVERIRPKSLEPFDFLETNMSGELWFAEGFTNYYDALSLCRSGVWSREKYIDDLTLNFNSVWKAAGRQFFNPIEMSQQAPFVDAAKSVDETNRGNTYISYYTYGEMLGLALDLSLREKGLNLDDYMKLVWETFGKTNTYYTVSDLQNALRNYAGNSFAEDFFGNYIYNSKMPNFEKLFNNVGIDLEIKNEVSFGAFVRYQKLMNNPKLNTTAYDAQFQIGDKIIKVGNFTLSSVVSLDLALSKYKAGDEITFVFERYGEIKQKQVILKTDTSYHISYNKEANNEQIKNRDSWLNAK